MDPHFYFYLWGNLEDNLYKTKPHTLEELGNNICHKISESSGEALQRVEHQCVLKYTVLL
jgi:hypothetical protein